MRRPNSISGLLLRLFQIKLEDPGFALRAGAGLVASALAVAGLMVASGPCPSSNPATSVAPGTRASRPAHLLTAGRCAHTGQLCVSDATCGTGDRCTDPNDLRGAIVRASGAHALDDSIPLSASLVWNGEGYGVAWIDLNDENFELYFARLSAAGQRLGSPVRVTRSDGIKVLPNLVASPAGYALTWTDVGEDAATVYLQRLGRDGSLQGKPVKVPTGSDLDLAAAATWNGREYAVAWYHLELRTQMGLRFARFGADGSRVGKESVLHQGFLATGAPGMAFMGDGYGVGWSTFIPRDETSQTLFVRVGAGGEGDRPVTVANAQGRNGGTSLAWNGRHFGMVWEDGITLDDEDVPLGALAFAGVSPTAVVVPRKNLTGRDALSVLPTLAWNGQSYGLGWTRLSSDGADVFFSLANDQGNLTGTPLRLTTHALGLMPSAVYNGTEFAIAWTHASAEGVHLRLARIDASGRRVGGDVVIR